MPAVVNSMLSSGIRVCPDHIGVFWGGPIWLDPAVRLATVNRLALKRVAGRVSVLKRLGSGNRADGELTGARTQSAVGRYS